MKEDKENTRPKERKLEIKCEDGEKTERSKEKKEAMTKVKLASCVSYSCYKSVMDTNGFMKQRVFFALLDITCIVHLVICVVEAR